MKAHTFVERSDDMNLENILNENLILTDLEVNSKKEAIRLLSENLKAQGYINNIEVFEKDIYYRETQGTTGIGNYIAIPHGLSSSVNKIGLAIGKLKKEIEWETLDDNGVKIICLFAVSNKENAEAEHLELLAQVASRLGNDEAVQSLLEATNSKEIKNVFIKEAKI